jgi:hypothetical protein
MEDRFRGGGDLLQVSELGRTRTGAPDWQTRARCWTQRGATFLHPTPGAPGCMPFPLGPGTEPHSRYLMRQRHLAGSPEPGDAPLSPAMVSRRRPWEVFTDQYENRNQTPLENVACHSQHFQINQTCSGVESAEMSSGQRTWMWQK